VRLADFVEVLPALRGERTWFNKIKSKHVDFLIWDLVESKIVLAIELDGKSHNGATIKKSDSFKDEMYEAVGLQLERVKVGSSFEEESKRLVSLFTSPQ
jgi:very-short-patch-repair endonuclease